MLGRQIERNNRRLLIIAFTCTYLFWGSSFVANRYGVQMVHPAVLAGLRYLIAGSCLLGFLLVRGESVRICRRDLGRVTGLGLIMFTCNTVLLGYGSRVLPAGTTALVIATIPLFMALLECGVPGGTTMNAFGWVGTITGFLGLVILSGSHLHASVVRRDTSLGFAALLLAALAWAIGSMLTRTAAFKASSLVCTSWQMLIGGVTNLLLGFGLGGFQSSQFTDKSVASIAYLALFGTLAGYTSYAYLLRNVKLSTAATYAYVNPVVAVLLGWLILGEALAAGEWIGLVLVLASVAIVINVKPRATVTSTA